MSECAAPRRNGPCSHCGGSQGQWRCKRRTCPGYGRLWAGDVRQKLLRNLEAAGESVVTTTITAPGADHLPWDGATVEADAARRWNLSAPARWRRLNRRAYQRLVRDLGTGRTYMAARVWEFQKRGVLHVHLVLPANTELERIAARAYVSALHELAPQYGFGFVDRKLERSKPIKAAAYLASYFVGGNGKTPLSESVKHPAMPSMPVYVSPRLSMVTGCTMRRLRVHRFVFVRFGRSPLCVGDTYHVLDRYQCTDRGVVVRR